MEDKRKCLGSEFDVVTNENEQPLYEKGWFNKI